MSWSRATSRDFSFGGTRTPENVGPGSYNINEGIQAGRTESSCFKSGDFTNRNIFSTSLVTPSPCDYVQESIPNRQTSTSTFKSRSKRDLYQVQQTPSPCDHSEIRDWHPSSKKRVTSVSKLERARPISGNVGQDVLGYEVNDRGRITHVVKKLRHGDDWVGPGSYSPSNPGTASPRVHSLRECYRKSELWETNDTPGLGLYNPDNPDQRYMRAISPRYNGERQSTPLSEGTAPVDWSGKLNRIQSSSFKSRSQRRLYGQSDETPSPADYQRIRSTAKNVESSSPFGQKSPRFTNVESDVPGPGQYEGKNVMWGKKGSSLVNRAVDKYNPDDGVPGPGSYCPPQDDVFRRKDNRPSSSFASNSKRSTDVTNNNPGPGSYNLVRKSQGKRKTIRASRFKETNNFMYNPYQDNPSPADYQIVESSFNRKRGRSLSRSDRFNYRYNDNPGPGSYEIVHSSFIKKSNHIDFRGMA